ncbi:MAG: exodeoxyribonuclease VII large subunit [Alphaproteobacteria bacterium]
MHTVLEETIADHPAPTPVYSVTQISTALKQTIEAHFRLVRVRGEISGAKLHTSGHLYFSLKDSESVLDGICWRGTLGKFPLKPTDGMEVICHGRLTTYGARSKYQIIVDYMEHAGVGALLKLLQERKTKLAAEGLFDVDRKKPLPFLPTTIGIITSPTGAVIQDILHRLQDRFPRHVLLWPVSVQGETAAREVAQAIKGFNDLPSHIPTPDVLIVARGGGSLEDLWAFNEEEVVRAVAASHIPIISAVGHETDTTLIDYVADRRAPTPTAAAEMAVPVRLEILEALNSKTHRLTMNMGKVVQALQWKLNSFSRGLISPKSILENKLQNLDDRLERLKIAMESLVHNKQQKFLFLEHRLQQISSAAMLVGKHRMRFEWAADLLESYSYTHTLQRGFALVKQDGHLVTSAKKLTPTQKMTIQFHDGVVAARVEE